MLALFAACGGQDRAERPPPAARPDPRLATMFEAVVRAGFAASDKARAEHVERQRAAAAAAVTRDPPPIEPPYLDLDRRPPILISDADPLPRARTVELRYQRGMRDYPSDLVDRQAEAARVAVERCLGDRDDVAAVVDRMGTVSMTVRIDHAQAPAEVRVVGGQGLETCVQRRVDVLPADGVFLAVLRIRR